MTRTGPNASRDRSPTFQRRAAAPHLAARRPPRARRRTRWSTGSPTAGQTWWQMLPLGPARPLRLALQGAPRRSPRGPACSPSRRAPVSKAEELDFRERERVLDRGLGALRRPRRGRRPGALRARVGALRALRGRARRAADRRRPDLRRAGLRRPPRAPRAVPATTPSRARRRTPTPTRASCGATRSTTGPRCGAAATAGGSSGCARTFALFDLARIDHFRGFVAYWAVPRGRAHALGGPLAARPGARAVRRRARARSARAAADRRGPRRDHAGGRAAARRRSGCRAWSCCSSASTPATRATPHRPRQPRRGPGRLHRHARQRHACAAGTSRSPADARALVDAASPRPACASPSRGGS